MIDAVGSDQRSAAYREGAGLTSRPPTAPDGFIRKNGGHAGHRRQRRRLHRPADADPTKCGTTARHATGRAPPGPTASRRSRHPDARRQLGVQRQDGEDPRHRHRHRRPLRLELRRRSTRPTPASGSRSATRDPQATTSSALFVAGIRRDAANPAGRDRLATSRSPAASRPSSARSSSSRRASAAPSSPAAHGGRPRRSVATINSTGNPLPGAGRARQGASETQDALDRPYYRSLQGMRVHAARGHRHRRRHDQVPRRLRRAGHQRPSGCSARTTRRRTTTPWSDAPAELGIAPDGGAGNPADPRLPWFSTRRSTSTCSTSSRNVVGPLSFSFSFYKVMPQLDGARRRRSSAARSTPPTRRRRPTPAAEHAARRRLQRRELLPGRQGERRPRHHAGRVRRARPTRSCSAIRNLLKEPDVIAVQEVAVFADGANALTGLAAGARQLHAATSPPTTTAAASRPASWSRTARRRPTARVIGADGRRPVGAARASCDLLPGQAVRPRAVRARRSRRATSVVHGAEQPLRVAVAPERVPRSPRRTYVRQHGRDAAAAGQERARRG